jgi:hypothetical protein
MSRNGVAVHLSRFIEVTGNAAAAVGEARIDVPDARRAAG